MRRIASEQRLIAVRMQSFPNQHRSQVYTNQVNKPLERLNNFLISQARLKFLAREIHGRGGQRYCSSPTYLCSFSSHGCSIYGWVSRRCGCIQSFGWAIVVFAVAFLSAQILNFKFFIFNLLATAVMLKPLKNKIKEQDV